MSALQDTTLLASTRFPSTQKGQVTSFRNAPRTLRKASSLAALYNAARHPTKALGGVRDTVEGWYDGLTKAEREHKALQDAKKRVLYLQQRNATTLVQWEAASLELDRFEGNNAWKREFSSPDYNPQELLAQLNHLEDARIGGDVKRMLHLIRARLSRNTAQMGNLKLYQYSHLGTKEIVERYIQTALDTLNALVDASDKALEFGTSTKDVYDDLLAARQSFGRSALLLSGGGILGMNHIGVVKTLWEAKLLPRIISGASAGSIVAAVSCTTTDEEVPELLRTFCHGDLAVFHDPDEEDSWLKRLARVLTVGSMFDIAHLKRVMIGLLGNMTFLEAYNRTRRILNICVSSSSIYELPKLLNYITSPHVVIWSAVAASCSVPLVFSPASLLIKDPRTQEIGPWSGNLAPQKWIDGSVENDIPMQRLSEMFNVNHFIVSQVNPHVVPFLVQEKDINLDTEERSSLAPKQSWLQGLSTLAKSEAIHRMTSLADVGFMPNVLTKTASVLSQTYSGDITILPEVSYADLPRVLSNPTPEFITDAILKGERATWPKLSRIRNHCAIELALDNAANEVRARAIFSKTEEAARNQGFKRSQSDDGANGRPPIFSMLNRLQMEGLENEVGPDNLENRARSMLSSDGRKHQKAKSTQISELLANTTLSPSLSPQETYDMSPRLQAEEVLSSGPGLTSDASDGCDDSDSCSLSSDDDDDASTVRQLMIPPITPPPPKKAKQTLQSTSDPSSPAAALKRSPFSLRLTTKHQANLSLGDPRPPTPPSHLKRSFYYHNPPDSRREMLRQKAHSEPEPAKVRSSENKRTGEADISDARATSVSSGIKGRSGRRLSGSRTKQNR